MYGKLVVMTWCACACGGSTGIGNGVLPCPERLVLGLQSQIKTNGALIASYEVPAATKKEK